jgi:hypothetical protein
MRQKHAVTRGMDCQVMQFLIPEVRPCILLGPHAGDGWTLYQRPTSSGPEEDWNLQKPYGCHAGHVEARN